MEGNPKRKLSLDTNVLLEIADAADVALDFLEVFRARGYELLIAPRVVAELRWLERYGAPSEKRLCSVVFSKMRDWSIKPFDLSEIARSIAVRFAESLILRALLPERELGDARILAETAVAGIAVLTTFDRHLLDIEEDALRLALEDADLTVVVVAHPKRLLRAIR